MFFFYFLCCWRAVPIYPDAYDACVLIKSSIEWHVGSKINDFKIAIFEFIFIFEKGQDSEMI